MRIKFIISLVIGFFSVSVIGMNKLKSMHDTIQERECTFKKLILKTERIEKERKFIF